LAQQGLRANSTTRGHRHGQETAERVELGLQHAGHNPAPNQGHGLRMKAMVLEYASRREAMAAYTQFCKIMQAQPKMVLSVEVDLEDDLVIIEGTDEFLGILEAKLHPAQTT
jgi:hypothetical protein